MIPAVLILSVSLAQQGSSPAAPERAAPPAKAPLPAAPAPKDAPADAPTPSDDLKDLRPTRSLTAQALDAHRSAAKPVRGPGNPDPGSLFAVKDPEPRTFAVHDLITIVVSEQSKSKSTADAKADKNWETSAAVDAWVSLDPTAIGNGFLSPLNSAELPSVGLGGDKTFKGKGSYNRSDDFSARVTAEIVEVRPNGLLVLEARREIANDGESQVIVLSGICRPEDIDVNNQVQSQRLADAVIKKTTTGQLRDTTEKGLLAKLFDAVFAF